MKVVKIYFHVVPPPFGSFWSVIYLNFGQKLPIRTTHNFLESRYPEVTKNPYFVFSPEGSQKKVSAHGLKQAPRAHFFLRFLKEFLYFRQKCLALIKIDQIERINIWCKAKVWSCNFNQDYIYASIFDISL